MSTPMRPGPKGIKARWTKFREDMDTILDREAKVRDLVKASAPLYSALGLAMIFGFGWMVYDGRQDDAAAKARTEATCRDRNSQVEQGRLNDIDTVELVLREVSDPTSPGNMALLTAVADGVHATVAEVDKDCNGDGILDSGDYSPHPSPVPPNLPIRLEN